MDSALPPGGATQKCMDRDTNTVLCLLNYNLNTILKEQKKHMDWVEEPKTESPYPILP